MKRVLLGTTAAALVAVVGVLPTSAATVSGSIWKVSSAVASDATVANVPHTTPTVTFTAPSPLSFNPTDSSAIYTIAAWLASGSGTITSGTGTGVSMDNTLMEITGTVSVHTGETFTALHDDGVTLVIGSDTVINDPGPTAATTTTETYTGPSGNEAFTLVYGECCGPPAELVIDLPLATPTPEPASFAILGMGLLGLGAARRFWAA